MNPITALALIIFLLNAKISCFDEPPQPVIEVSASPVIQSPWQKNEAEGCENVRFQKDEQASLTNNHVNSFWVEESVDLAFGTASPSPEAYE